MCLCMYMKYVYKNMNTVFLYNILCKHKFIMKGYDYIVINDISYIIYNIYYIFYIYQKGIY